MKIYIYIPNITTTIGSFFPSLGIEIGYIFNLDVHPAC